MGGTNITWLTIGISLVVIVLGLTRIIGVIISNRLLRQEGKRFQAERAKRAKLTEERIDQLLQTTLERIRAHGKEVCERIRAHGEKTRGQIAETHLKHTGKRWI